MFKELNTNAPETNSSTLKIDDWKPMFSFILLLVSGRVMPKQNSSSPTPIPVERRRRRVSTEGSVRERKSSISLKYLVVNQQGSSSVCFSAKQEGSLVMFGQLLSAKKGRDTCSLAEQAGGKLSWKRPYDPRFRNALADTSARREANAGSPVQRICQLHAIFACYQDFSEKDLRRAFFGRFEFQLARGPLPSAMEARRMTLLPQDLQSCCWWLVPSFLQPRTEGRTRCRDRRYEDSPLQTNDQGIFLKKQENPPTKKAASFQGNRYSNNDMIQQNC